MLSSPGIFLPDSVSNPNPLAGLNQCLSEQVPGMGKDAGSDGAPELEKGWRQ